MIPSPVTRRTILRFLAGLFILDLTSPAPGRPASSGTPSPTPPAPPGEPTLRGYTKAQLEAMLESADPKQRVNALLLLRETGATAVPIFIWALQDEDPSVRIAAVKSFVPLGTASEPAAVPLANLLETEPIPAVQKQIIFTLGQMGPYATEAVPVLRQLQREANLVVRVNASQALDRILSSPPRQ